MKTKRTIRIAAFAASLAAWCGWGMMEARAQADAWITSTAASNGTGSWTNMLGTPSPAVALPAPGGALGYNGQAARYSQHIRTNGSGQLIFFEVDGNLYDGDGYLIADARTAPNAAPACTDCLAYGVMEFLSMPVPASCGLYFLFSAVPVTTDNPYYSHVQLALLDMTRPNPRFDANGQCNPRMGRLVDFSNGELYTDYPQFANWEYGAGYVLEPSDYGNQLVLRSSDRMAKLPIEAEGKSQSPMLRLVQGATPNAPSWLFAVMTTKTFVYKITANGINPVSPLPGYSHIPTDDNSTNTQKLYTRDADARLTSAGTIQLVQTDGYGLHIFPDDGQTHNLLSIELNATTGQVLSAGGGYAIRGYRLPDCLALPPGAIGLAGCALAPGGNAVYVISDVADCQTAAPSLLHVNLLNDAVQDITSLVPITAQHVKSRFYRNRALAGNSESIYVPRAGGVDELRNIASPTSIQFVSGALAGAVPPVHVDPPAGNTNNFQPVFLNPSVQGDTHLSAANVAACCTYFQTVPGIVAGGFTRTAGQSNWNGATNEVQPGSNVVVFNCDVVVEPGGRLFASNMTWKFTDNAKVIVKPGGYLDLNNCTLTSITCYQARWPGVEAWGNGTLAQNGTGAYQIPTYQGKLNAVNSTIENAQIGVLAGRRNSATGFTTYPLTGGAVILMNGSTLRNCERGVDFRQYPYLATTTGALPPPNLSRFTRTNFLTTNPQGGAYTFTAHARLDRVNGIQFRQCTFKNAVADAYYASGANPLGSIRLGYGIESYESEFKVWPGCTSIVGVGQDCPAANVLPTVFEGLDHGIHALGGPNALRNFTVDRATFTKNICGVYSSGVIGFVAKRSSFSFGNRNVPLTNPFENPLWFGYHRGLYSYNGYGFTVDDNSFTKAAGSPSDRKTEGVVIGYSKDHNVYVFRNTGSNLMEGFVGEGVCASLTAGYTPVIGLQFKCNTNQNNDRNLLSRKANDVTGPAQSTHTIRSNQGEATHPMDNLFDGWDGTGDKWDFRVKTDYSPISYWHRNSGVDPYVPQVSSIPQIAALNYLMNPQQVASIPNNNCTFKVPRLSPLLPDGIVTSTLRDFVETEKLAYGTTRYLYEQLLDGGSTDEVVAEITSAWPQDAWDLRAYLLSKSPYLTTGVLKDLNAQNKLPQAMFVEVCIANPDATKAEGFTKWLEL